MENSSLLSDVSMLTQFDYESIIQSLITNVDQVWVNALAFEINSPDIRKKLHALKEAGLIRMWDYEMNMGKSSGSALNKVLTLEEYRENSEYLKAAVEELGGRDMDQSSDFTTLNIERRNMISNFLLARSCGAESIIQRNSVRSNVGTGTRDVFQAYTECLFCKTNIKSVSNLSIEKIMELRKYSKYFRDKIQEQINAHLISGDVPLSVVKQDCEKLSREYCEEINSRIGGDLAPMGTVKGVMLDIASFWLSSVTWFSISQKLLDAAYNRKQRGFIMYLTTLQNSSGIEIAE